MNRSAQPASSANPPAQRRSKPKLGKAETILAGALEVFTAHGYAAASMDRIATAAGVSKPTLYTHFKNKEGLFVALIQQLTQDSRQRLLNLPKSPNIEAPPEKVLTQLAMFVLEKFSSNQSLMILMRLIIGESGRFPELAKTFVLEVEKPLLTALAAYMASQPQLNFLDPMVAARIFTGSIAHYMILQTIMQGSEILPLERDLMVKGLVHQMMAGERI